jgi:arylsulfatase A-like enzyme
MQSLEPKMNRTILKISKALPTACLLGLSLLCTGLTIETVIAQAETITKTESESAKTPNLIFVLSDDIAQGDLGCYGQKLIKTPRLDQMAKEGTRYLQAYCGTSVCAPCRSSFFTGLHSGHCPVRGNYEVPPEGQFPLPDETVTIAEVAKATGYSTATFGKWGMGNFDSTGSPFKQGVDHFFGYNCQRHAHSYFPTYLYSDDQPFILPGNNGRDVGETYAQELIQNDMLKWLRTNAKDPFLMFYAITLPHGRHEIDDHGIYKDKPWTEKQKSYAAQVTRVDTDMGELVDTLRELGIAENTLIIFIGDNGSSFDPESEIGKRFDQASNGLRGYKRGMYEGALRQAAIAWWPGTVPAKRVDDQPWAIWDIMPTFVELADAPKPKGYETDGFSLLKYLKGGPAPKRDYFYWELHLQTPIQAARFGNWKAVRNGITKPIEIYDLVNDVSESNDLAAERPDLVEKAKTIFAEAHRPDPSWPLEGPPAERKLVSKKTWKIKRQRDKTGWIPPNAKTMQEMGIKIPYSIAPAQDKWYQKYRTQQNAPEPADMILNTDAEPDLSEGFTSLFNGTDLEGWTPRGGSCKFEARDGVLIGTCVPKSQSTYLCTDRNDYRNFIFTCDMKWEVDGNSGVMFRSSSRMDKEKEIVFGPQVEMEGFQNKDRFWSGGIYGQSCGGYFYPLWLKEHQAARDALKTEGWNRVTVLADGNTVKSWVNGVPAAHWEDDGTYPEGFFGLQVHKGKQGTILWRNIQIKELPHDESE